MSKRKPKHPRIGISVGITSGGKKESSDISIESERDQMGNIQSLFTK